MTRRALQIGAMCLVAVGVAAVAIAVAAGDLSPTTPADPAASSDASSPNGDSTGLAGVTVRPVDGGADYYARFEGGLPSGPDYFPIAVWFASVTSRDDAEADAEMGLNTYVELTANSSIELIEEARMHAIPSVPEEGAAGVLVADEVDMWAGPGHGDWTGAYPGQGQVCVADDPCGYTIMEEVTAGVPDGVMTVANFGKGVAFWESDDEAQPFLEFTDVVSADTYWFTDPNICGATEGGWGPGDGDVLSDDECRRSANYGWTVEHVRSLVSPTASKPVWNLVEVGQPFGDGPRPAVTGSQIRAAVWSSVIHGARGIVYFNHNMGGGCVSDNVLRDACGDAVREDVTSLNHELAELAPTLNAPFIDGLVSVDGDVDVAVKLIDDGFTIFAAATRTGVGEVAFTSECRDGTVATVLGEDRSIPVVDGRFTDTFADADTVHLYRLDGGSCGL